MARVAFLGNCQSLPTQVLTRNLCSDVTVIELLPVHLMKPEDLLDAVNRCEQADVIIRLWSTWPDEAPITMFVPLLRRQANTV